MFSAWYGGDISTKTIKVKCLYHHVRVFRIGLKTLSGCPEHLIDPVLFCNKHLCIQSSQCQRRLLHPHPHSITTEYTTKSGVTKSDGLRPAISPTASAHRLPFHILPARWAFLTSVGAGLFAEAVVLLLAGRTAKNPCAGGLCCVGVWRESPSKFCLLALCFNARGGSTRGYHSEDKKIK